MTHTAKVLLTCDIKQNNKIIFENIDVYFWADVLITFGRYEDDLEINEWESEDAILIGSESGYLYTVVMNEFGAPKEFEEYMQELPYTDFTLLVKSEEFSDVEIDYGQFEPDWDMMREGK